MFKKILLGCGVLLLLIAGFVFFMLRAANQELKPLVADFMAKYNAGTYDQIYAGASEEFRKAVTAEQLAEMLGNYAAASGKFVDFGSVTGSSRNTSTGGSTADVTLGLKFEKGEASAKFSWVWQDERWELLNFELPPVKSSTSG